MDDNIYCNRCGETSPNDAQFCIGCGIMLAVDAGATIRAPLDEITCPDCYALNVHEQFNCTNCGRRFPMQHLTLESQEPSKAEGAPIASTQEPKSWKIDGWDIAEIVYYTIEILIELHH